MNARSPDAGHRLDGAAKLALEGADPRHVLHEGGEAERAHLVVELVTRVARMGQALFGQQHAGLGRLAVADRNGRAIGADVEPDIGVVQRRSDAGDILAVEARVKRLVGRTTKVIAADSNQGENRKTDRRQGAEFSAAELQQIGQQPLGLVHRVHQSPDWHHRRPATSRHKLVWRLS